MHFEQPPEVPLERDAESAGGDSSLVERAGAGAKHMLQRVRELAPEARRKNHHAGLTVSILGAVALLSAGEVRAESGKKTPLEQMDEATLIAKPTKEILRLLDTKKLQLPSEAQFVAAMAATAETGGQETFSEKVELSWDNAGTIGVVSSFHSVQRATTEALDGKTLSKDEQSIDLRVRVVRPGSELEMMDTGKVLTGEGWGSTKDAAIMSALSEIAQSYETKVFSLMVDRQASRQTTDSERVSAEEQQAILDITAVDSAEYMNDVHVMSVEKKVINGQPVFEARVEAEIVLPVTADEVSK